MMQILPRPIQLSDQVVKAADEASSSSRSAQNSRQRLRRLVVFSARDISWLLRVSAPAEDRSDAGYLGLPPIAANEPILCLIWEHIALLHTGSLEDHSDAAASFVSNARDNDRYTKLTIEEGGVGPLLTAGEQVSAAAHFTCCCNSTRETMGV
ncbi:hypothetical protein Bca4012_028842 [Brassica carinata]